MSHKKWIVNLTDDERTLLLALVKKGNTGGRRLTRAHIVLLSDEGKTDEAIAEALHTGLRTVERTRQRCVEGGAGGVEHALNEQPRPKRGSKLDGHGRAMLVATACSAPPAGHAKWTLRLLAGRLAELQVVDSISHEAVRQELKKTVSSPG